MYDLNIHPRAKHNPVLRLCMFNNDKDGAMVAARLASALGGVASSRPLSLRVDRPTDADYFRDMATRIAGYYKSTEYQPGVSHSTDTERHIPNTNAMPD